MSVLNLLVSWLPLSIPVLLLVYYVLPFLTTFLSLSRVPGPFSAKFSNIWLGFSARNGGKFAAVDWAHRKYGKVVRVGYNHVSIADERALQVVYAHGNGFLKDTFYEAFVVGTTGMFNTRDRVEHTRKRKLMAHAFSPKSVGEFEPYMKSNLERWVAQLDRKSAYPTRNGFAEFDAMPWFSYLAFDIIGDLAFGSPFGMVEKGRDEVEMQLTHGGPVTITPAVEVLNRRGEISSTLGLLPALRPYAKYLPDPFFTKGVEAVANLNGIAVRAVASRLDGLEKGEKIGSGRNDILERLINGKDAYGNRMDRKEITAEALTQLIAGSDTISNTSCAVFYWILHGERARPGKIIPRLQAELDAAMPHTEGVASYAEVKNLPFLKRCIDEGMRLHSTSAIGLPRIVVGQAVEFDDYIFPPGTVLSVPSYTIHHLEEIWGPDVEEFKPDRWLSLNARQKMAFNPFSYGPRACVGQNVAVMELQIIIGTVFRRYEFQLYQNMLESHEGFSKKPRECLVGLKRRVD
ncbi:cytochrome P450 [Mollisia scopiformis]|uniref:Cytochrome P450 n=1 Tax=Mollisia scopiformis TaxID=149040 RepID=A0A194X360_MOLSC|nr:cytochrome P450 [Mollisia scopiformis]KUJ14623.1 cytochrome P450 [Mollisia scopiformis]